MLALAGGLEQALSGCLIRLDAVRSGEKQVRGREAGGIFFVLLAQP